MINDSKTQTLFFAACLLLGTCWAQKDEAVKLPTELLHALPPASAEPVVTQVAAPVVAPVVVPVAGCTYQGIWTEEGGRYHGPTHSCTCQGGEWVDCIKKCESDSPKCENTHVTVHKEAKKKVCTTVTASCETSSNWCSKDEQCGAGETCDLRSNSCLAYDCGKDTTECKTHSFQVPVRVPVERCTCGVDRREEGKCVVAYRTKAVTKTKTVPITECETKHKSERVTRTERKCHEVIDKHPLETCDLVEVPVALPSCRRNSDCSGYGSKCNSHTNKCEAPPCYSDVDCGFVGTKCNAHLGTCFLKTTVKTVCNTEYYEVPRQVCQDVEVYDFKKVPFEVCHDVPTTVEYIDYVQEPYQTCTYHCVEKEVCPCSDHANQCFRDSECAQGQFCSHGVCRCEKDGKWHTW